MHATPHVDSNIFLLEHAVLEWCFVFHGPMEQATAVVLRLDRYRLLPAPAQRETTAAVRGTREMNRQIGLRVQ